MKREVVTQQDVHDHFVYDADRGQLVFKTSRGKRRTAGAVAGSTKTDGYRRVKLLRHTFLATHLIWMYHHGKWPAETIDHKNGVIDDNHLDNLREATRSQNCANKQSFWKKSESGFRGVVATVVGGQTKYRASIACKGIYKGLGTFDSPEEAAKMYDAAATAFHDEFARLNFPTTVQRDWLFV